MDARFGSNASGHLDHNAQVTPPATRRVGVREVPDVWSFPVQVGHPAYFAYFFMGSHSAKLAFQCCDANRSVRARLLGQV